MIGLPIGMIARPVWYSRTTSVRETLRRSKKEMAAEPSGEDAAD
jgi:hypothetical protein